MSRTRVFRYAHTPVRVRVRGGEPVWFTRDLAAALGVPFPPGPLLPASPNGLLGIATAAQVRTVIERAGSGTPNGLRAWMTDVSAQLTAPAPRQPALAPVRRSRPARDYGHH
ncbi:hypothetical protein [Streptomyces tirandamycinicus]|uniref:Bro-N domain-containing protein n=1 Tax=Streptomyces tirandamycinicus TaxID=2174846 RepID=A0A2S1T1V3_9ACTN|nr:hypothetical protein [Streptomyces tirandamycinicus]AWI32630.1 hypothetical protein DDW44_30390 [Streptomyces tirandamycinicus]